MKDHNRPAPNGDRVLVSACLLGRNCKYSGGNSFSPRVADFLRNREAVAVCPELMAGLGVPRTPMEIVDGLLTDREGKVHDGALRAVVAEILEQYGDVGCAVLKSRSPTCGVRQIYDGSFSGHLIDGAGVLARALLDAGWQVYDSEEL